MHDTVQAVLRDPAFHRSVRNSIADRLLIWLLDWLDRLGKAVEHLPSGRDIGLGIVALLVLFLVARLLMVRGAERESRQATGTRRRSASQEDPWQAAELLAGAGRYEEAAHALYRGVILSLGRVDRIHLDPSRTSGDYARELRRRGSSSVAPFRAFTRRFDVAVYGHGGATAEAIEDLRQLSVPFRTRAQAA
ncbi:MAG: hypothetical protein JWM95_640 [Gemmatimonadetes bacterium]|nr:hypothetical protein [Gemmatimonadota bacterium]